MIKPIGILSTKTAQMAPSFKQNEKETPDNLLLINEREKHPIATNLRITTDKFQNALTVYPVKGLKGSRNANFYEFLTMGMVPYVAGSAGMIAVFNLANRAFKSADKFNASVLGRKMALGVVFYGITKNLSQKLIEAPLKAKTGIDVSLPYRRKIYELPDSANDKDLQAFEYHKVFESVDFPRWDLLYDSKFYGDDRNSYYDHVAAKMGYGENLNDSDQIIKPKIKEKVVQARTFETFSKYLWAAVSVGVAMQKPWDRLASTSLRTIKSAGLRGTVLDFGRDILKSCKDFYKGGSSPTKASSAVSKALLGLAVGTTLIGNLVTLIDFNKIRGKKAAAAPIIDDSKAKVVC